MPWVRIDDDFTEHPKLLSVGPLGIAMQVAALCYANSHLTDGFIHYNVMQKLIGFTFSPPGSERILTVATTCGMSGDDVTADMVADWLVDAGVWEKVNGGYYIHDYPDYQPSKVDVLAVRKARSVAGIQSGKSRRARIKQVVEQNTNKTRTNDEQPVEQNTNPVPVPVPIRASGKKTATRALPSARQEQNAKRAELEQHFAMASGLPVLKCETIKQKRSAGELWWGPLREILELQQWDDYRSKNLIDLALARMRENKLTVSSPKSILNVARAIFAEGAQERILIEHT